MNLAERIKAAQAKLATLREDLTAKTAALGDAPADADLTVITELSGQVEAETKSLDALLIAEKALAQRAAPIGAPALNLGGHTAVKNPADLLIKAAVSTLEAYLGRIPVQMAFEQRYGSAAEAEQIKAVLSIVSKATQNPAMTNVPGWAQELVQDGFMAFMDLLAPESVVPRMPLNRFSFDSYGKITVPMRKDRGPKNLAGAFRAEGAPIRVGSANIGAHSLTPKSLGVIGTFTNELFQRSTPNIEALIKAWMVEDTAIALDGVFLGAVAGSATQPAGMQAGLAALDTAASAGATAAEITTDLRGRLQRMADLGLGRRPVWVMNPARAWGLGLSLTAAGTPAFPEMAGAQGTLLRIPVVTSTNVPAAVVFLIDAAEVMFAGGAPSFMGTEVATIHEEDTTPLSIDAGVPARSLFQTNSSALRALWELDWSLSRPGAVQTVTAVAW